jgi:hypothetical protein
MGMKESKQEVAPFTSVCPHCAGENAATATLCRHCMGPLITISNTDPFRSILAEGDAFGLATRHAAKPIVLVGMWLLFGPAVISLASTIVWFVVRIGSDRAGAGDIVVAAIVLLLVLGIASLYGAILFKTTRSFVRHRAAQRDE